ncbi:MAG: ankyrin repeat domain-containing protein [Saprospiraceae bacterium]
MKTSNSILSKIARRSFGILFLLFTTNLVMTATLPIKEGTAIDGPYVFYRGGEMVVKYVNLVAQRLTVSEKKFSEKAKPSLTCPIEGPSQRFFSVTLHDKIDIPPTIYPQPKKLFAISDIEGDFSALAKSLRGNGVINEKFQWIYGTGHLVLVGDFFDRGLNVTACLWLIYELERQATLAGGSVHFIIGNHEEMNMRGDLRYVQKKYKKVAEKMGMPYTALYGPSTELGRWLRAKNIVEKIGNTIFVHGGLSQEIVNSKLSLIEINNIAKKHMGSSLSHIKGHGPAAALVFDTQRGPMWYRGYFGGSDQSLVQALDFYNADKMVVGHTVVKKICTLYDQKLYAIDVKHSEVLGKGAPNAILQESGKFYCVSVNGAKNKIVAAQVDEVAKMSGSLRKMSAVNTVFNAIKTGTFPTISEFLAKGNDVNGHYSSKKYTLLHYAIKYDRLDVVKFLVAQGASIESRYSDQTCLMYAIKYQQANIIRYLIAKGVRINAKNQRKQTAIFYAASYADLKMTQFLVDKGAKTNVQDAEGKTPLTYAQKHKNKPVALYLRSLR